MRAATIGMITVLLIAGWSPAIRGNGAVCLYDSTDIEVKKDLTAVVRVFKSLEITTEAGTRFAELALRVNDYMKIEDIEGHTILPDGQKVKLRSRDIQKASAGRVREFGGIEVVQISLRSPVVGARLNYRYTMKIKSLLYLPGIVRDTSLPAKRFVVRLKWPRSVTMNFDFSGLEIDASDQEVRFFADDLPEFPSEDNACPDGLYLYLSADIFSYNETKYYSRSWADIGRFFALRAGQPESRLLETRELGGRLAERALTRVDTLEAIFNYVADSVAYVPLEIGRGGFDPHPCGLIIERRYGDCKDQAILLASLLAGVGIEAHPALVFTGQYPDPTGLHPWPAVFDHAIVVVEDSKGDLILDPSDPRSSVGSLSPALRRKSYLPADGRSGLRIAEPGPQPTSGIRWEYAFRSVGDSLLTFDFSQTHINDAAALYDERHGSGAARLRDLVESYIRKAGWMISAIEYDRIYGVRDSLQVTGRFRIPADEINPAGDLELGSPLIEYLLGDMFEDVRESPYCYSGSILLEEVVSIPSMARMSVDVPAYHDVWLRDSFEFTDDLSYDGRGVNFHRLFEFKGGMITSGDFNGFRDFLLSSRNQRYVRIEK